MARSTQTGVLRVQVSPPGQQVVVLEPLGDRQPAPPPLAVRCTTKKKYNFILKVKKTLANFHFNLQFRNF